MCAWADLGRTRGAAARPERALIVRVRFNQFKQWVGRLPAAISIGPFSMVHGRIARGAIATVVANFGRWRCLAGDPRGGGSGRRGRISFRPFELAMYPYRSGGEPGFICFYSFPA